MELIEVAKKAMLAGLAVPEKLKEVVDDLVKRGELSESQGAKLVKEWGDKAEKQSADLNKSISELVDKTVEKFRFAPREEHDALRKEVEALAARLAAIERRQGG